MAQVNPHTHQLKLCDFGSAKVLVSIYWISEYFRVAQSHYSVEAICVSEMRALR